MATSATTGSGVATGASAGASAGKEGTGTPTKGRNICRPATVAFTTLIGFRLPRALADMSLMPATSITARTAPPAMMPAPVVAGFMNTLDAPYFTWTACGMVLPCMGTSIMAFLAIATPFRTASGTATPLPMPKPTLPLPSPITTMALKVKWRPPLTTLATRRI